MGEQGVEAESVGGGQQWLARALEYARVHAEKTTAEIDATTWHWKERTRGELQGMMPGGVAARGTIENANRNHRVVLAAGLSGGGGSTSPSDGDQPGECPDIDAAVAVPTTVYPCRLRVPLGG